MVQNKIKTIRLKKRLTLTELSRKSGLSRAYISLLENGIRNNPSHEAMEKIAEGLGKSVQVVFFSKN
ncbi:helix-turn-helix transcriptional regulator [Clostridium sp. YIM B02515]|uniref:Helix-turn-helix transcriptional regulator n=1 Tax=Clostridium rhizosphaerae TaxID=2803861 RepID=A0ABS1T6W5_9CLOT|nr:helix-turn-helix transcriptional regulator [Clostridium rhizosphaerae]MBL4935086.1 helix-turn-helix transcriptional regulator [Clostridium rhizosphaerae]